MRGPESPAALCRDPCTVFVWGALCVAPPPWGPGLQPRSLALLAPLRALSLTVWPAPRALPLDGAVPHRALFSPPVQPPGQSLAAAGHLVSAPALTGPSVPGGRGVCTGAVCAGCPRQIAGFLLPRAGT